MFYNMPLSDNGPALQTFNCLLKAQMDRFWVWDISDESYLPIKALSDVAIILNIQVDNEKLFNTSLKNCSW